MEPVEYRQRHRDVGDDGPRPEAVEVQLDRMRLRPRLLQGVDRPHGQIRDEEERDDLPPGLPSDLLRRRHGPPGRVQDEDCLERCLHHAREGRHQHEHRVLGQGELGADYRERRVDEHPRLGSDQQNIVQLQVPVPVVAELPHLEHPYQRRHRRHPVQGQLAHVHLGHGEADQFRPRYQHEEQDQGDDRQHQDQDADEQALVGAGAVHAVVVGRFPERGEGRKLRSLEGERFFSVFNFS